MEITIEVYQKLKTETTMWSGNSLRGYIYILEENENTNLKRYMYPNSSVIYSRQDMNTSVQETNG